MRDKKKASRHCECRPAKYQTRTLEINAMELTVYQKMENPLAAMETLGEVFYKSGMFNIERPEQGRVFALACLCEQMNPFELLRTYHCISGRLSKRADMMLAEFKNAGGKCKWLSKLNDASTAKAHFIHGENDFEASYTMEDAKREGLSGKGVWQKSPADMLRARLVSKVMRMIAPEIVAGVYAPEEMGGHSFIDTTAIVTDAAKEPLLPDAPKASAPAPAQPAPAKPTVATAQKTRGERLTNNPAKTEAPKPAPTPAPVIDVASTTEPPKPAAVSPAQPAPVLDERIVKLKALCDPNADIVNKFLRGNGYIQPEQTFLDAATEVKESILARSENFFAVAKQYCDDNA